jgi:two-component system CheB/CheR fusion protein
MGALVLDYQTVELDELLDDVSNALKASVARRQVEFVLEAVGIDGMIEVDRARLREALVLVSESVISRSPAKTQVMLMATIKDRAAVIRIDSTTRRAAQETSRFFAVLGSGKLLDSEDFSSIGLKLTLSRLLIELHGGSITATSDLSGDIFTIIVPICCQKSGDFIS